MKTKIFKKAVFGGFDKKDVMTYISELSAENAAERARSRQAAEELEKRVDELAKANQQLISGLAEQSRLTDEIEASRSALEQARRELEAANAELEAANASLEADNTELRSELDSQVGKIFTQARINAQSIVHEARIKAEAMDERSGALRRSADDSVDASREAIIGARDDLRALLDETAEKLEEICDGLLAQRKAADSEAVQQPAGVRRMPVKVARRSPIAKVK